MKFDLVTLIDVIGHVNDPLQELKDIKMSTIKGNMCLLRISDQSCQAFRE